MTSLHAVIMAGGSGTRFWPASRTTRPKQMLPLAGGRPLITATVERLTELCDPDHVWIATNRHQVDALRALVPDLDACQFLVEPEPRNTAPCVALATAAIAARDPFATMVVMPADHVIDPRETFQGAVRRAVALAADDETLVTFGIAPTRPATGFGYIECGAPLDESAPQAFRAVRFREKPDAETAAAFLEDGSFLWNSGIFVWTAKALLAAMERGAPELATCTREMTAALASGQHDIDEIFARTPRTSIDYAVMEHAPEIAVVRAEFAWNDVGGFGALDALTEADDAGNHALLSDDSTFLTLESRDNLVYAEGGRAVSLFGVNGLVVVDTGDALMVCPRDRAEELKQLVEHVRRNGHEDLL